jgi:hypothetical protein
LKSRNVRITPPSTEANNQDVFIWALYLLGGADSDVDVEAVYLKSFELAPARLGWRTQPKIPDYKKTSKALQSVEASTHVGLVHKVGPYTRRLTAEGAAWVERYRDILESTYSSSRPVAPAKQSNHENLRRAIKNSLAFKNWRDNEVFDISDLADALECSAASPRRVWKGRIEEVRRAADVTADQELSLFANMAEIFLRSRIES